MLLRPATCSLWLAGLMLAGCATPSGDVKPLPANPADFATWGCARIDDELDRVQQRAADVAYAVDERAGNNILALGIGVTIFWPSILAMRPDGLEAAELARLKGRFEALRSASTIKQCPPAGAELSAARAATFPIALGDRLVYAQRSGSRGPMVESAWRVVALRRGEIEYRRDPPGDEAPWLQDHAGNVTSAPSGALQWRRLLRPDLELGQVTAGEIEIVGDPLARARLRGQVVAVGPQTVAGRRFDVAVVELFGDAQRGDSSTRVEGAIVVDRSSGVLLRLDLVSAQREFSLQRRLARVEPAAQ